jgi:hypothetical protein
LKKLNPFLAAHQSSPRAKDVTRKIIDLEAEKKRITESGQIKLDNRWLSAAEYAAEKYQVDAAVVLTELQEAQARNDFVSVLNLFDQLEKTHPLSAAYLDAVEPARKAAETFNLRVTQEIGLIPTKKADRDQVIERTPAPERATMRAAIERQEAQALLLVEQARKRGLRFYPPISDENTLRELQRSITDTLTRLRNPALKNQQQAVQAARDANRQLAENDLDAAEASLAAAQKAWSNYEALNRLKARIEGARKTPEATKSTPHETPAQKPGAATPTPSPSPVAPL